MRAQVGVATVLFSHHRGHAGVGIVMFVLAAAALAFTVRPRLTARRLLNRYRGPEKGVREPTDTEVRNVLLIYYGAATLAAIAGVTFVI